MGFATSLQALTRLTLKSLPATLSLNPNFSSDDASKAAAEHVSFTTNRPKAKQISIPVIRANRSRSRLGSKTLPPQVFAATPELHSPIADQSMQAASPRLLKIVQREPRRQPECLLICGRMADVCAALERMALHEQTAPQV